MFWLLFFNAEIKFLKRNLKKCSAYNSNVLFSGNDTIMSI